ncbi:MAG: hypothetical protein LBQ24_07205 [Candidatus Peribacteria bacterium]|nr:hypothetical protein [Candidatus Peribacteria bacterium]
MNNSQKSLIFNLGFVKNFSTCFFTQIFFRIIFSNSVKLVFIENKPKTKSCKNLTFLSFEIEKRYQTIFLSSSLNHLVK